jgi:hypothetical protein
VVKARAAANATDFHVAKLCDCISVLLQDINTRKPFKSSIIKDQQVISLATRPLAITEVYRLCEPPPPLQKLNPYRFVFVTYAV